MLHCFNLEVEGKCYSSIKMVTCLCLIFNLLMHNVPKQLGTLQKSCSICCKTFKVSDHLGSFCIKAKSLRPCSIQHICMVSSSFVCYFFATIIFLLVQRFDIYSAKYNQVQLYYLMRKYFFTFILMRRKSISTGNCHMFCYSF